jgi:DNA-binding NarL/FixJ family response regulator
MDREIRTLVLDDHEMVGRAFAAVLQQDPCFEVVGVAIDAAHALAVATRTQPDLLVTDLSLATGEVLGDLPRFAAVAPDCRVLVVTGMPTERSFIEAMRLGAGGFMSKLQPLPDLVHAARRVAVGEVVFPQQYVRLLIEHTTSPRSGPRLSMREIDVLQLLARGASTTDVAAELFLAVNTVRNHLATAMAKLGVSSRLAAVAEAERLGLVSPPAPAPAMAASR